MLLLLLSFFAPCMLNEDCIIFKEFNPKIIFAKKSNLMNNYDDDGADMIFNQKK